MSRGFGAREGRVSLGKTKGDSFASINTSAEELRNYLEEDHSKVTEWSPDEVKKVADLAGKIREAYPPSKKSLSSKGFDSDAVEAAMLSLQLHFNKTNNPNLDTYVGFAKGFNSLDKAIAGGNLKDVGRAARDILNKVTKESGEEYVNEVDAENIEDPFMSGMLKGLRGLVNIGSRSNTPEVKAEAAKMAKEVYDSYFDRGSENIGDFNEMFERDGGRFPSAFDLLRKFDEMGVDVNQFKTERKEFGR